MGYTTRDLDRIVRLKSWSKTKKINELLRIDCDMYTNMGIDSTKTEKQLAKKTSRKIYRLIKTLNPSMGSDLLKAMDQEYA
jgi:hypothetical protein